MNQITKEQHDKVVALCVAGLRADIRHEGHRADYARHIEDIVRSTLGFAFLALGTTVVDAGAMTIREAKARRDASRRAQP